MDIIYNVNSYHLAGIPKLIGFLRTNPNLHYRDYATIVSRFYNEVRNCNTYVSLKKIKLIQECMYVLSLSFKDKIYGYDEFLKFMGKMHHTRLKTRNRVIRNWIINTTENPDHPIGKRRKMEEYNDTFRPII